MSKYVKNMIVDTVRERIGENRDLLVVDSSLLDGNTTNRWRLALREKDITVLTVGNSLARRALNDLGISTLDPYLSGPSTLVWGGEDIVALSKEIARWVKEVGVLKIKGGTLDGQTLTADDVREVSQWPSREELLSIVAGQLLSVAGDIAGQLTGPARQIASQISTLIERQEEAE